MATNKKRRRRRRSSQGEGAEQEHLLFLPVIPISFSAPRKKRWAKQKRKARKPLLAKQTAQRKSDFHGYFQA